MAVLENTGLAVIYIGGNRVMPEEEIEVADEVIESVGVKHLIARGELAIVGNSKKTKEIRQKAATRKKDKFETANSADELENGGEYK